IPRYQTWRPLQRTKPKVDGPQIAQVVGPKGEEIFTDNVGRVRVQFFWDREGKYDDHSSCWIRVSQAWAGQGWGVLAIPRVGQEVLVDFLDGDPDQPIITGRTYHTRNVPPGALPQSKTQMALRSKTYKGEGYNELLFEDAPGQEQLNLHAQRDMNTVVLNDCNTIVSNRHQEIIKKNQTITVQGDRNKTIHENEMTSVLGNSDTFVEKSTTKQVKKDLVISSQNGSITFSVGNSLISLDNEGTLCIQSDEVKIDGGKVFFNQHTVVPFTTNAIQDSALISSEDSTISNTNSEEMEDAILAAYLSNEVYKKGLSETFKQKYPDVKIVSDKELLEMNIDPTLLIEPDSDFQANIYKKGDNYFLVYRGTESLKDIKTDLDGSVGEMNLQFERATDLAKELRKNLPEGNSMVIAGHSLGGELASIGALATGVPTYTYNSAGLHPKIIQELELDPINEKQITAFYTNKDALSLLQDNRVDAAKAVLASSVVMPKVYIGVELASNVGFDHSITNIALGVLRGDNLPQAIGNRVKLNTDTGHTISALKEIEWEIRKYYEK
ncbi:type VI secretion system tip protein TssI/VgrG, partial [Gallibacterium anatis]